MTDLDVQGQNVLTCMDLDPTDQCSLVWTWLPLAKRRDWESEKTALLATRSWCPQLKINSKHSWKINNVQGRPLWPWLNQIETRHSSNRKMINMPSPPLTNRTHCRSTANNNSSPFLIFPALKEKLKYSIWYCLYLLTTRNWELASASKSPP